MPVWPLEYWKCYREDCSDPGNEKTTDQRCLTEPRFSIDGIEVEGENCPDLEIEVTIPNLYYDFALHGREINGQYVKTSKYRNGKVSYRKAAIFEADYQIQDNKLTRAPSSFGNFRQFFVESRKKAKHKKIIKYYAALSH